MAENGKKNHSVELLVVNRVTYVLSRAWGERGENKPQKTHNDAAVGPDNELSIGPDRQRVSVRFEISRGPALSITVPDVVRRHRCSFGSNIFRRHHFGYLRLVVWVGRYSSEAYYSEFAESKSKSR